MSKTHQELFSHSTDLMVILDTDGCVVEANSAFLQLLGKSLHEVIGRALAIFTVSDDRNRLLAALKRLAYGSGYEHLKLFCMVRENDSVCCDYNLRPSSCGQHVLAIGRNLDAWPRSCSSMCREYRSMERLIEERTRNLKQANSELSTFNFSISHELQAPLRAIKGFSRAIIEDYGNRLDHTGRDYLLRIYANSERMSTLIAYLLQLSRLSRQQLHYVSLDLGQMADIIIGDLRAADPSRSVVFRRQGDMVVEGDRQLLFLLMQNLLDNAWKYTSRREAAEILFSVAEINGERIFSVVDNGVGFPDDQLDRLFTLFQRLHSPEEYEGMGIGLATAQRVVQRHGGRIWAESPKGRGRTGFHFTLNSEEA